MLQIQPRKSIVQPVVAIVIFLLAVACEPTGNENGAVLVGDVDLDLNLTYGRLNTVLRQTR
jgi:hypothetical protein